MPISVGNQQTVIVSARTGGVVLDLAAAGLGWDSAVAETTMLGEFGPGWTWQIPSVQPGWSSPTRSDRPDSDVPRTVYVPRAGLFQTDQSSPTGLAGYVGDDVRYAESAGTLPARDDVVPARGYVATLTYTRLGSTHYLDIAGNAITTIDSRGGRIDREFGTGYKPGPPRFVHAWTDAAGARTTISYYDRGATVRRPGSQLGLLRMPSRLDHFVSSDGVRSVSSQLYWTAEDDARLGVIDSVALLPGVGRDKTTLDWGTDGGVIRVVYNDEVVFERG